MSKWEWKEFEDCIERVKYTTKIPSKDYLQEGEFPIVSQEDCLISGYWNDRSDLFKVTKPIVIFGDHTKVLKYIDFDFVLGADGVKILCPKDYLNAHFFFYFLKSVNFDNLGYARHYRLLKELSVPIPPLSEQKRIVKFLDDEFSKIETLKKNAETNLKNAKELFETTLEKELNPPSRHSERSEESSADLPSGWELKALGDVCYRIKRGKAPKYVEQSDVLVFAQKCNQPDGTMSLEKALCLDPSILGKYKAEDYVKEGDVLVNSTGNGTVGRVGFFNNKLLNNKKTVVPDTHITTIRGLANTFPKYLYYFLKPKESYLSDKSLGTTNMKELHADILEHLQIPLPPLSVQKEIVVRLDKLSENVKRLEANYKQIIANCDELKKSILKKTFEGDSRSSRE